MTAIPAGDLAAWQQYFDELELAMRDFEIALTRREVEPLREIAVPQGAPPEQLRERWLTDYQRISELEFRALALREDLRTQFTRLHGVRRQSPPDGYGSSLDISG